MDAQALASESVSIVFNPDNPAARFQAVAYASSNGSPRVIHSCANQGTMTSWLVCNGYRWIEGTSDPQRWEKI
jgi:hypothetical protein